VPEASTLWGFLTGVLTSGAVAAIITQSFGRSRDRSIGRQKIMEFLIEKRQQLDKNSDLLKIIELLRREKEGDAPTPPLSPTQMRELPSFLEPIGIYLRYNPDAFQRAYQVFADEVELCAKSRYMWLDDDYISSPYWTSFKQFVANTEENLAEQKLPRTRRVAHQLARRFLNWLEA
jgi:hypothetical protein